jgi:hypothetical protein
MSQGESGIGTGLSGRNRDAFSLPNSFATRSLGFAGCLMKNLYGRLEEDRKAPRR